MVRSVFWAAGIALLTACATWQPTLSAPSAGSSNRHRIAAASGSCCNIFWNKKRLTLRYGSKPTMDAVLTYWAPNGYYLTPLYCANGSQITDTAGRPKGSPSGYERVKYSFTTQSRGPDSCAIDAVLNNTGSPPIAILKIRIQ